jgi:hypothetical protein
VSTQKATTYALEYSYLWKMLKTERAPREPELPDRVTTGPLNVD